MMLASARTSDRQKALAWPRHGLLVQTETASVFNLTVDRESQQG